MDALNQPAGDFAEDAGAISLRPLTIQDIPFGLRLTRLVGWNQTEADWRMLLEHSTAGSFLALCHGVEAGTVTTVTYAKQLNWVGMVLVAPEFRGQGIGSALLRAAIQAVKGQGALCLDATPAGEPIYRALGFKILYRLGRWLRPAALPGEQPAILCGRLSLESLAAINVYDRSVFGADRSGVLSALLRNAPSLAFSAEQAGEIAGYSLGRNGQNYVQIGPLVADNLKIARDLLLSALQTCARQEVILDTTFHLPGWNLFLQDQGFVEQRPFARMCLGEFNLPEHHARQLAIAGPEIG